MPNPTPFADSLAVPGWQPPRFDVTELRPRSTRYCFAVITLDEGERLRKQLQRMQPFADRIDLIVADGRSTDGSTTPDRLGEANVRALISTSERGLGTAIRMALAYALCEGYEGVTLVDGNGKDGVEAVPEFISALDAGYDFVQGSRFLPGGHHEHTPLERYLGVKYVMSPILSLGAGRRYTDVTNGFKAMSRRFLLDPRVQPLRDVFVRFNLQLYLNYRAARLGFRVREIPVVRVYPEDGSLPTKIVHTRTKVRNVLEMALTAAGHYNPPSR